MTKIVKPTTKEQLIYFMAQHISLGTYDKKFLVNVRDMKTPLTSNQASLLDKIIVRYHKQFAKHELDSNELIGLPWTVNPIQSIPQYTDAHINVEDDQIIIRTPYKKEYVDTLKKYKVNIVWDRDKRIWYTPFCEATLKYIIHNTEKHFNNTNYCNIIKNVIAEFSQYEDSKYWNPTLIYTNNSYYVVSINEPLYNAIHDLLNQEVSIATLAKLVSCGVAIDDSVSEHLLKVCGETNENAKNIILATEVNPTLDISKLDDVVSYINAIGSDLVILAHVNSSKLHKKHILKDKLAKNNIDFVWLDAKTESKAIKLNREYKFPVIIDFTLWYPGYKTLISFSTDVLSKTIFLVDSQPIDLEKTLKEKYENM